jgi:hypothetical protein
VILSELVQNHSAVNQLARTDGTTPRDSQLAIVCSKSFKGLILGVALSADARLFEAAEVHPVLQRAPNPFEFLSPAAVPAPLLSPAGPA